MMKKKKASDFRYDTGTARVPWAAVGETVCAGDVNEILRFLVRPAKGKTKEFGKSMRAVEKQLSSLWSVAAPAGKLTLGNRVSELEAKVRKFLRAKHAIFLTNATAGFEIAYKYAGLRPGDEVIAPAITFIATIAYPLSIGAKVVLADVDPRTINMDPEDVARKVTRKTKVIVPVHIGGRPCDMAAIMKISQKRNITVLEDAAHAFGAVYRGRMAGTIGHFGAFSFHEVKNVTSMGEGGILVTDLPFGKQFPQARFLGVNPAKKIKNWLYDVDPLFVKPGCGVAGNHSATEIQAVGLLCQMKRLAGIIAKRKRAAAYLTARLKGVPGIVTPVLDSAGTRSTWHLYLLQVDPEKAGFDIQDLKARLSEKGIVQIPHFAPLYKFQVMKSMGYNVKAIQKSCPNAEEVFNRRFTHLPLYDFTPGQLKVLADAVMDSARELRGRK